MKTTSLFIAGAALLGLGAIPLLLAPDPVSTSPAVETAASMATRSTASPLAIGPAMDFSDVAARSREFIGYYESIQLTPQQDAIKTQVLGSMPAPCCGGSSALTCCCPCNLSKTIWGLSNYALAKRHANAEELRALVVEWIDATNPDAVGRGSGCYRGTCGARFDTGGCGGMSAETLNL